MDQPLQGLAIQEVSGVDERCAMGNMHTITFATRPTLNSIRQTDVDTMIRTQSRVRVRVRVRVIYLNQTGIRYQILGGVGVRVMHSRSDAPSSNPTHSILNCFFLKN